MATKLYYWGIKARAQLPVLICLYSGVKCDWEKSPDWPGMKDQTPFGQLPYLVDGDVKIAQSLAIARYLAKKGGIDGSDNLATFAMSEQLIEEQNDIYNALAEAQYSKDDKTVAWNKALNETVPKHFGLLEKLLTGTTFTGKITAGDIAIFSIINIVLDVDPHALDKFAKLKAFYDHVHADSHFKEYLASPPGVYFKKQ